MRAQEDAFADRAAQYYGGTAVACPPLGQHTQCGDGDCHADDLFDQLSNDIRVYPACRQKAAAHRPGRRHKGQAGG